MEINKLANFKILVSHKKIQSLAILNAQISYVYSIRDLCLLAVAFPAFFVVSKILTKTEKEWLKVGTTNWSGVEQRMNLTLEGTKWKEWVQLKKDIFDEGDL